MTVNATRASEECIERFFIQQARGNIANVQVMGVEKDMIKRGHQVCVCEREKGVRWSSGVSETMTVPQRITVCTEAEMKHCC